MKQNKMTKTLGLVLALMLFSSPAFAYFDEYGIDPKEKWNEIANYKLPDYSLPEVQSPEKPELSKDYNDMKEDIIDESNKERPKLDLPDVEKPEGSGETADDVFKDSFGDLWNERELEKESVIPEDEYFDSVYEFRDESQADLQAQKVADEQRMEELNEKELDSSRLWDMDEILNDFNSRVATEIDTEFLANTPKPDGWGDGPETLPTYTFKEFDETGLEGIEESIMGSMGSFEDIINELITKIEEAESPYFEE